MLTQVKLILWIGNKTTAFTQVMNFMLAFTIGNLADTKMLQCTDPV
tara:strand:+ start:66847 stop:66984 length:138 start_codon:yes stop_codon:yes gene_type:complete